MALWTRLRDTVAAVRSRVPRVSQVAGGAPAMQQPTVGPAAVGLGNVMGAPAWKVRPSDALAAAV